MHSNVILTFNADMNEFDNFQEVFNLNLRISPNEKSSFDFLNRELFPRIVEKCSTLSRDTKDLIKISTAIHAIVQQSKCRIGVSEAVERASLACSRAYQQLILFEKIPKCLVESIRDCSIS